MQNVHAIHHITQSAVMGMVGCPSSACRDDVELVPLEEVAGHKKLVPADHPWLQSARLVGTCLGD